MHIENDQGDSRKWVANWIWQETNGPADQWMCFRKTFELEGISSPVIANIAVDSKYWMWINGELAVFEGGLKRGPNRNDTYIDKIDISNHLKIGTNTIAILVWFFGKDGQYSHNNSGKGGLFFEASMNEHKITSDSTWKTLPHPAYEKCKSLPLPNFRLPESNIRFNADLDICHWYMPTFDDSMWIFATEKGVAPIEPWNHLSARPIPQWKVSQLTSYCSLYNETDHSEIVLPHTTQKPTKIFALIENNQNLQVTPYLRLTTQKKGAVIDIRTDYYEDGGNGTDPSVRAEYLTKCGDQSCELLGWMNGQRVEYTIPEGITIIDLKYRESGYDCEFSGNFECNDGFINRFVNKAKATLYVNMRDAYYDCPNRERAQWITDASQSIAQAFHVLDRNADKLSKKAFDEIIAWHNPITKEISDFAPADPADVDKNKFHIQVMEAMSFGVWTYYMYTGDLLSIKKWYPIIRDYIFLWTFGEDGLVNHRTGDWDMVDNKGDTNHDMKVLENAWVYNCLKTVKYMAEAIGHPSDLMAIEEKINCIEINFDKLWDHECRAYRSYGISVPDVRGNALAVYSGLANEIKFKDIKEVLTGSGYASVNLQKFVYEALFMMGYEEDAFCGIKTRYDRMVNDPYYSTLWEEWNNGGWQSSNHAWAGGPMTLLFQYCAGIMPELPGFEKYQVLPQEGSLNFILAQMPSVKGNIVVQISKVDSMYTLDLISPENTRAVVGIPKKFGHIECIFVNEVLVWDKGCCCENAINVSWNGEENGYYKFNVGPGEWQFKAIKC